MHKGASEIELNEIAVIDDSFSMIEQATLVADILSGPAFDQAFNALGFGCILIGEDQLFVLANLGKRVFEFLFLRFAVLRAH